MNTKLKENQYQMSVAEMQNKYTLGSNTTAPKLLIKKRRKICIYKTCKDSCTKQIIKNYLKLGEY